MVLEPVLCSGCGIGDAVKQDQSEEGKQRYKCRNQEYSRRTFI